MYNSLLPFNVNNKQHLLLLKRYVEDAKKCIPNELMPLSEKMHINFDKMLTHIFFDVQQGKDIVGESSVFLGLLGNYMAAFHLSKEASYIVNEMGVIGSTVNYDVDVFYIKNEIAHICEVKATPNLCLDSTLAQSRSAKKALQQIDKLIRFRDEYNKNGGNAKVEADFINFDGCRIDPMIIQKLKDNDVNYITIPVDIHDLLAVKNNIVRKISEVASSYIKQYNLTITPNTQVERTR